jgi:hypothetical protein
MCGIVRIFPNVLADEPFCRDYPMWVAFGGNKSPHRRATGGRQFRREPVGGVYDRAYSPEAMLDLLDEVVPRIVATDPLFLLCSR